MSDPVADKLQGLRDELKPLSPERREAMLAERRLKWVNACLDFKNYIWGVMVLILLLDIFIRIAFGAVNLASSITPFGSPVGIAGAFTGIAGASFVLFSVIDFLYSRKFIGCNGLVLTKRELERLEERENAFFIPGCVYDCRMIQNRIDFNTIRYFIPIAFAVVLINTWVNEPASSAPPIGTPEGIRYACSHLLSYGVQVTIMLCIIMNLYAMRRRRPRIDTLHIDAWFDVHRFFSDASDHAAHNVILQ